MLAPFWYKSYRTHNFGLEGQRLNGLHDLTRLKLVWRPEEPFKVEYPI